MKSPRQLCNESEQESYIYFDKYVRPLPKREDGSLDLARAVLQHNDVDAFRHAYVSGIFTYEYGENGARLAGWLNEAVNIHSQPGDENMDHWNNAVGRRLAKEHKTKEELVKAIKKALDDGELVISLKDERQYKGTERLNPPTSVIVLKESKTGSNEIFFDVKTSAMMTKEQFLSEIDAGHYVSYIVKNIGGVRYPVSKTDDDSNNNLG